MYEKKDWHQSQKLHLIIEKPQNEAPLASLKLLGGKIFWIFQCNPQNTI